MDFNWRNRCFLIGTQGERIDLYKYGNRLVTRDGRELTLREGVVRNKHGGAVGYPVFRLKPDQQALLHRIAESKQLSLDKMDKKDRIRLSALKDKGLVHEPLIGIYEITETGTVNLNFGNSDAPNPLKGMGF